MKSVISYKRNFDYLRKGDRVIVENVNTTKGNLMYNVQIYEITGERFDGRLYFLGKEVDIGIQTLFFKDLVNEEDLRKITKTNQVLRFYIEKKKVYV